MEEIIEVMAAQIVPAIAVILATLISIGMTYLIKWIKMKTNSEAVAEAGEVVASTVNDLMASTVKGLKEASADGKLTLTEADTIKHKALAQIKNQMPTTVAKAATMAIGDLDTFLKGKIEQEVIKSKK